MKIQIPRGAKTGASVGAAIFAGLFAAAWAFDLQGPVFVIVDYVPSALLLRAGIRDTQPFIVYFVIVGLVWNGLAGAAVGVIGCRLWALLISGRKPSGGSV